MVAVHRLAVLSCLVVTIALEAAAPPAGPLPSRIAAWVAELGDDSFAARQEATRRLRLAGPPAEAALEKAVASSKDAEVLRRARAILADFRWGIFADTPESVVELIRAYQSAARSEKRPIVHKLLAAGTAGYRALSRVSRAEDDPLVRKEVFADIATGLSRSAPTLLDQGEYDALESVLDLALAGDVRSSIGHYAAYHLLRGRLPARIAEWEVRARAAVVPKAENEVLAYLYRANGDLRRATLAATEAERTDLVEAFLYEQADWKELARRPELTDMSVWPRGAGYRAAYARLAGDGKGFAARIDDLRRRGKAAAEAGVDPLPFAKALFLNAHARDALSLLPADEAHARLRYEVHVARLEYTEAFALVEEAVKGNADHAPLLELLQARTLAVLGEKARAAALLKKHAAAVRPGALPAWVVDLIETELSVNGRDDAFARAARVLAVNSEAGALSRVFGKLFERKKADQAVILWTVLRDLEAEESVSARLARLRRLIEGTAPAKELTDLLDRASRKYAAAPAEHHAEQRTVLAEVALAGRLSDQAMSLFREAATPRALLRAGDLLAGKKQWAAAATQYEAAYRKATAPEALTRLEALQILGDDEGESQAALPLYLAGHALVQAGRRAEGLALQQRAHLLPLGDLEMRFDLSRALARRGHDEAARRESDLLRRLGEPSLTEVLAFYTGEGLRAAASEAGRRKDFLKAADGYEQAFLRCLQPTMNFQRTPAYVLVPAFYLGQRARGLVAAGRFDEARTEIDRSLASAPGGMELALQLIPELDRAGRTKDADALFRAVKGAYVGVTRAYPRSAGPLNQAAWLSAVCRRDLGQGLEAARQAVALAPDTAAYQDTLAEVLFQLGKKDEAIEAQKRALALQPNRAYFKHQLRRLQAGDPKAPRPSEDDE